MDLIQLICRGKLSAIQFIHLLRNDKMTSIGGVHDFAYRKEVSEVL